MVPASIEVVSPPLQKWVNMGVGTEKRGYSSNLCPLVPVLEGPKNRIFSPTLPKIISKDTVVSGVQGLNGNLVKGFILNLALAFGLVPS